MTADSTVEWGEGRPVRWLDRFLGDHDESGQQRISAPALGCGVVAAALLLAAELTPWAVVERQEIYLGSVGGFQLMAYYPGWMALLTVIGVALVVRPGIRRLIVAGGLGLVVALLIITAGIGRQATDGGPFQEQSAANFGRGPGMYFGFAGVLVAAAALILAGWRPARSPGRRPDPEAEEQPEPGPADLTVTPLQ